MLSERVGLTDNKNGTIVGHQKGLWVITRIEFMNKCIGYKESNVGHKTKTIETYNIDAIWCDCDVVAHGPGWCVVSWLARAESVNRDLRIAFGSHQNRFRLSHNYSSTSTMAGNSSVHPSFMCREPFNREEVTHSDTHIFTGSATNLAEPYPSAYGVCHLVTTTFLQWQKWAGGQRGCFFGLPPCQQYRFWRDDAQPWWKCWYFIYFVYCSTVKGVINMHALPWIGCLTWELYPFMVGGKIHRWEKIISWWGNIFKKFCLTDLFYGWKGEDLSEQIV